MNTLTQFAHLCGDKLATLQNNHNNDRERTDHSIHQQQREKYRTVTRECQEDKSKEKPTEKRDKKEQGTDARDGEDR